MKVLSLSMDCAILNKLSLTSKRAIEYGALVDKYFILVPAGKNIKQDLSDKVVAYGVNVDFLNKIFGRVLVLSKIYRLAKKIVREEKIDVITTQDPFEIGLLGYLLARKFKIGLNIQLHGDFFGGNFWKQENPLNFCRYYLGCSLIKKADSIRAVSERIKNSLIAKFQINSGKIINVPIFTDYNLATEQIVKNDSQEFVFLTAGRLVKSKNFPLLLKVFAQITKDNDKVKLIIQGSGPEEKKLKVESKKLQVDNKISFLPYSAEGLKESYGQADCFVLPSNHEGWGLVTIEASLHNLPVIMTDVGCAGEIIKNNESGLVVPVGDEEALKSAMLKMMSLDNYEKNKFIINAKENIAKLPNKEETLKRYYQSWQLALDQAQLKYAKNNLLFVTQKVDKNDGVLGFVHQWLKEFSDQCDLVTVICLQAGEYDLPKNVKVISLGKEDGYNRIKLLVNYLRAIWQERDNYQNVLVHMAPIYLLLGGLFWRIKGKKIGLWYSHRQVDLKFRIAEKFSNVIFTASEGSFKFKTNKLRILGHGILVDSFKNPENIKKEGKFTIISVGRITPIKNLDILIKSATLLKNKGLDFQILIVGTTMNEIDRVYFEKLKKMVSDNKLEQNIIFVGPVPYNRIAEYYWRSDLSINLCPTGGIDKAVLESMAAGLPVIVSNQAFVDYFGDYKKELIFKERDEVDLSEKILSLINNNNKKEITDLLLKNVKEKADLRDLVKKMVIFLNN